MAKETDSQIEQREGRINEEFARLSRHRIDPRHLKFDRIGAIAASTSGARSIHLGYMKKTSFSGNREAVAVKVMNVFERSTKAERLRITLDVLQEVSVWAKLNHPNILSFGGFWVNRDYSQLWLISSYYPRGSLWKYIHESNPSFVTRWDIVKDTANGLEYLHTLSPPVYHGDLKAANILLNNEGRALLCDFRLAGTEENPHSSLVTTNFTLAVTIPYQSPEQLEGGPRTLKSDMWSWGCVVLETLWGQSPYKDHHIMSITKALTIDKLPPADVDALKGPESVRRLLTGCWRWEPESRLSIGDCVEILQTPPVDVGGDGGPSASSPNPLRKDQSVPNDVAKVLTQVDRYRIEPSRLKFSKSNMIIGQGNYSRVLRARLKIGLFAHGDVAVKQVYVDKDRPLRNFSDELAVWTPLTHPNIVSLLGFCSVPEEHIAWLVTPYMVNGDVKNYLKRNKPPMQKRLQLAHDIAKGLEYLHTRKPPVIHRDVRATNCLVTNEGVAAITDFGLAKPYTLSLSDVSLKPAHGPVRWMAPERVDRSTRGNVMTDIWAWGCTALEVITGLPPYSQSEVDAALYYEIGTRQTPPANVDTIDAPPAIRELLSSCWEWEPDERPNITHCVTVLGDTLSEMQGTNGKA